MKNKVYLTGSKGFLGSAVLTRLLKDRFEVIEHIKGNRPNCEGCDIVINCASELKVHSNMYTANVELVSDLLNSAAGNQVQLFIHIGSSSEYGLTDAPMTEFTAIKPVSMYAATKAAGADLVHTFGNYSLIPSTVILRPFSIYGPGEKPHKLFSKLAVLVSQENTMPISLYKGVHDWIYIDDVVDAIMVVIDRGNISTPCYNIGSGVETTNKRIVEIFEEISGTKISDKIIYERIRNPFESEVWVNGSSLAKKELDWQPMIGLKQGIRRIIYGS